MKIGGKTLSCNHCGGGRFKHHQTRITTDAGLLLGDLFGRKYADLYACSDCGMLHWFIDPPEPDEHSDVGTFKVRYPPGACPECGVMMQTNQAECVGCGFDRGSGES